jgi:hypothetical protein
MIKQYDTIEDMFKDLEDRIAAGKKAAVEHPIKVEDLHHGDFFAYVHPIHRIPIFGEVLEYPDEEGDIREARDNGYIFARCFSAVRPSGELGDTHITHITHKIPKIVFDRAKANGFRHLDSLN